MAEEQQKDPQLHLVYEYVEANRWPTKSQLYKVKSKSVRKCLLQLDRLLLKNGVLHRLFINNDVEYHQLILPKKYRDSILESLHDDQGHQGLERTLSLIRELVVLANYVPEC